MKYLAAYLFLLGTVLSAWGESPFSVDIRNWSVKAAARDSLPAEGYRRVVFTRATMDPSRDYARFILPPDRFRPVKFRDGTRLQAPPVPSVLALQALLEYLGYGEKLKWTDPVTGLPGSAVDGAFGLATREALGAFIRDTGLPLSSERVDLPLYELLFQLYTLGTTGAETLVKPVPGVPPVPAPDKPLPLLPAMPADLPQVSPSAAVPEEDHSAHSQAGPEGMTDSQPAASAGNPSMVMEPVLEGDMLPADIPWNRLLESWNTLDGAHQGRYEAAAREELAKDGPNALLALKILLNHGWKQNRKSLIKGSDGIWLPRRFWQE